MAVHILASFTVTPGFASEFNDAREMMVAATRAEPGCMAYNFFSDEDGQHHVIETFIDEAAYQAHRQSTHMQEWRATMDPLFERPPIAKRLEPLD